MKAAVIEHYGVPEQFKIKELSTPQIKEGQVLIRNRASSVNPVDTLVRQGKTMLVTGLLGDQLLGSDFSGVVISSLSSRFEPGDEVFGLNSALKGGAYAEQIVADEDHVAFKPESLSFTEAGVLPLVGLTAWQGMVVDGNLAPFQRVLITGCTGGVGSVAVQIAKALDAHVTGTCNSKNVDFARSLGADQVIAYDQQEIPAGQTFDLIFDASGNFSIEDFKQHLNDGAMFVSTKGGADGFSGTVRAAWDMAFEKQMKIIVMKPNPQDLETLRQLADDGKLRPHIARTFQLEELAQAHEMMEKDSFNGKIAIEIS